MIYIYIYIHTFLPKTFISCVCIKRLFLFVVTYNIRVCKVTGSFMFMMGLYLQYSSMAFFLNADHLSCVVGV